MFPRTTMEDLQTANSLFKERAQGLDTHLRGSVLLCQDMRCNAIRISTLTLHSTHEPMESSVVDGPAWTCVPPATKVSCEACQSSQTSSDKRETKRWPETDRGNETAVNYCAANIAHETADRRRQPRLFFLQFGIEQQKWSSLRNYISRWAWDNMWTTGESKREFVRRSQTRTTRHSAREVMEAGPLIRSSILRHVDHEANTVTHAIYSS